MIVHAVINTKHHFAHAEEYIIHIAKRRRCPGVKGGISRNTTCCLLRNTNMRSHRQEFRKFVEQPFFKFTLAGEVGWRGGGGGWVDED